MKKEPHLYPEWALVHRKPKTELRFINGTYYLYSVSSFYDKELKKGRKKTGPLLGKITESLGFVPSSKLEQIQKVKNANYIDYSALSIREYGFSKFMEIYGNTIIERLKQFFPEHHRLILYMVYARLAHHSPINRMAMYINKSMISVDDQTKYFDRKFSDTLTQIGIDRDKCMNYMKSFLDGQSEYFLFDMTNFFSHSTQIDYVKQGYNSEMIFDTQINLMYIYSTQLQMPVYYRLQDGNTREVSAFKTCLEEAGIRNAVIISDKGFHSKQNIENLQSNGFKYIQPLRRNDNDINYDKLNRTNNPYFMYENRIIFYVQITTSMGEIYLFEDDSLKLKEQKDYILRIENKTEGYSREEFNEKLPKFGTFALLSNLSDQTPEQIYKTYKSRNAIEVMFDGVKNVLHSDTTYMQKNETLQGWMFINHIALQYYYIIYNLLNDKNQLKKYSVRYFIEELLQYRVAKINGQWKNEVMTKSTIAMLEKLNLYSVF
jgi:Transposase DDE domain